MNIDTTRQHRVLRIHHTGAVNRHRRREEFQQKTVAISLGILALIGFLALCAKSYH